MIHNSSSSVDDAPDMHNIVSDTTRLHHQHFHRAAGSTIQIGKGRGHTKLPALPSRPSSIEIGFFLVEIGGVG